MERGIILIGGATGSGRTATAAGLAAALLAAPGHRWLNYFGQVREHGVPAAGGDRFLLHTEQDGEAPGGSRAWATMLRQGDSSTVVVDVAAADAAHHVAHVAEAGYRTVLVAHASDLVTTMRGYVKTAVRQAGLTPARAARLVELVHHQVLLPRADGRGRVVAGEWVPVTPEIRWCLTRCVEEWRDGRRVEDDVPRTVRADISTVMLRRAIVRAWRAGLGRSRLRQIRTLVRAGTVRAGDAGHVLTARQRTALLRDAETAFTGTAGPREPAVVALRAAVERARGGHARADYNSEGGYTMGCAVWQGGDCTCGLDAALSAALQEG